MIQKNWKELIKPQEVKVVSRNEEKTKNVVEIEPLERGFGLTLGNALRRVLLSSLQGAAVTAIKIDGIVHEFSTAAGVREDVIDMVLNIKGINIKVESLGQKILSLNAKGPCEVTAGMITAGGDVEILNPDHVICHLDKGSELNMELFVNTGKGYVPASAQNKEDLPLGTLPIDALYAPIKKVSYKVENARVGQMTNYDKLIMDVETDGSIQADDAIALAARILQDQLAVLVNFEDPEEETVESVEESLPFSKYLLKKVSELELSVRSVNCLQNDNIIYIGDLVKKTEGDMLRTPNFGRKSLNEIKEMLGDMGLHLGMEVESWPPENIEELVSKLDLGEH